MVRKLPKGGEAMGSKLSANQYNPRQSKRFIKVARDAEAGKTEEGADRAFKAPVVPKKHK